MIMNNKLEGKVVMITGGAEKAGRTFSLEFAKAGADIVMNYWKVPEAAAKTKADIEALGRRCLAIEADVSSPEQMKEMAAAAEREFGHIDVLIHNAANFNDRPLFENQVSTWDSSMDLIAKGPFFLSQAVAKGMLERGHGRIIAIIGNSYYENWPNYIPHAVSKVALVKMIEGLAVALSPVVQCNAICPSLYCPSEEDLPIIKARGEAVDENFTTMTYNGTDVRIGKVSDVAELLLYLATCSDYMNGAVIPIDGGKHLI